MVFCSENGSSPLLWGCFAVGLFGGISLLSVLSLWSPAYNGIFYEDTYPCQEAKLAFQRFSSGLSLRNSTNSSFDMFFVNQKIIEFQKNHLRNCCPGTPFLASLLTDRATFGFGSAVNNAVGIQVTASIVTPPHRFQFLTYKWNYEPLNSFFEDFAASSSCALIRSPDPPEAVRLLDAGTKFSFTELNRTFTVPNSSYGLDQKFAPRFQVGKAALSTPEIFQRSSLLLKSVWQPRPELKEFLHRLWKVLTKDSSTYFGIHIRRGDRAYTDAVKFNIRAEDYAAKLRELCYSRNNVSCPKTVFVASDEKKAFPEFREAVKEDFKAYNLASLVRAMGYKSKDYIGQLPNAGWNEKQTKWSPEIRYRNTKQLIIELTLLGMAGEVLCPYTSNLCRLIALLRGTVEGIHSMDFIKEWHPS